MKKSRFSGLGSSSGLGTWNKIKIFFSFDLMQLAANFYKFSFSISVPVIKVKCGSNFGESGSRLKVRPQGDFLSSDS